MELRKLCIASSAMSICLQTYSIALIIRIKAIKNKYVYVRIPYHIMQIICLYLCMYIIILVIAQMCENILYYIILLNYFAVINSLYCIKPESTERIVGMLHH